MGTDRKKREREEHKEERKEKALSRGNRSSPKGLTGRKKETKSPEIPPKFQK